MLILLSCAKTMSPASKMRLPVSSAPRFEREASEIALQMSQFNIDELERMLRINAKLAVQNYGRFQNFHSDENQPLQSLFAYTGIVFKRLNPLDFTKQDFDYAQEYLRLTSFCYGLLRPLDRIKNYRLEGDVRLPGLGGISLFDYWKPILTDLFIEDIKTKGGVLLNLASGEMKGLFDWKRVEREVNVITPVFQVNKVGKLSTVVIYTKMARGEMTRFVIKNRLSELQKIKTFDWEGFTFRPEQSDEKNYLFTILH